MSFFSVSILTPTKVVAKDTPVNGLYVPTCKGQLNILPEHTHLVTMLEVGFLTLFTPNPSELYVVSAGILRILKDKIVILTQTCEKAGELDQDRAKKSYEESLEKLSSGGHISESDYMVLHAKIQKENFRMQLGRKDQKSS